MPTDEHGRHGGREVGTRVKPAGHAEYCHSRLTSAHTTVGLVISSVNAQSAVQKYSKMTGLIEYRRPTAGVIH